MASIENNAPRYPSNFVGGTAPADVTTTAGHADDNVAAGRAYRDSEETSAVGLYPTDGGRGVGVLGSIGSPSTKAIVDLQSTFTALSNAITAFQTADDDLTTAAEKADFAEGKLNRINWLRENALNMTEEINKLLGKFDILGLYKSSPGTNSNIVSDVPAFITNLPTSPYPTDWGRKWPHTTND